MGVVERSQSNPFAPGDLGLIVRRVQFGYVGPCWQTDLDRATDFDGENEKVLQEEEIVGVLHRGKCTWCRPVKKIIVCITNDGTIGWLWEDEAEPVE